jgi:hypothetical protein
VCVCVCVCVCVDEQAQVRMVVSQAISFLVSISVNGKRSSDLGPSCCPHDISSSRTCNGYRVCKHTDTVGWGKRVVDGPERKTVLM